MQIDLQYEPGKNEEYCPEEQQPEASLEKEPVFSAMVPAKRDELENAEAQEPHEIPDVAVVHVTIVACHYRRGSEQED